MYNEYISFPNKYLELTLSACRDMGFYGEIYDTLYYVVDIYDPDCVIKDDHIQLDQFPNGEIIDNVKYCIDELKQRNVFKPNIYYNIYVGDDSDGTPIEYMYRYDKNNEYFKEGRNW